MSAALVFAVSVALVRGDTVATSDFVACAISSDRFACRDHCGQTYPADHDNPTPFLVRGGVYHDEVPEDDWSAYGAASMLVALAGHVATQAALNALRRPPAWEPPIAAE